MDLYSRGAARGQATIMIGTIRASLRSFHRGGATGPPSSAMRIAIAPRSFFSNRSVLDYEMAAANSCVVSPYCYNTSALRFMGGGPQNPEHKRTRRAWLRGQRESERKAKSERTLIVRTTSHPCRTKSDRTSRPSNVTSWKTGSSNFVTARERGGSGGIWRFA